MQPLTEKHGLQTSECEFMHSNREKGILPSKIETSTKTGVEGPSRRTKSAPLFLSLSLPIMPNNSREPYTVQFVRGRCIGLPRERPRASLRSFRVAFGQGSGQSPVHQKMP